MVASLCLWVWMRRRGLSILPGQGILLHGIMVGLLFGGEFACSYVGTNHTLASRTVLLVYTAPFFVALGAHWWIPSDRLSSFKAQGLLLAFGGVGLLFVGQWEVLWGGQLLGDALSLLAGVLWATTTLYIKLFLVGKARPVQVLFYQLAFFIPLLFACSLIWESLAVRGFSWPLAASLFYQCVIVAFLSFLWWFRLVDRYPVSLLHGFTFFTPILGVFISDVLLLGEPLTWRLLTALALASLGMVLVNKPGGVPAPGRPRVE